MKKWLIAILVVFLAVPCAASTRLMKLKEDHYMLTHQKQTGFGGQGKALRMNYVKAGSLCVILGYSWFEIKDTQSKGRSFGSAAAATMEVKFYREKAKDKEEEELYNCAELATEEQKEKMEKALTRMKKKS